MRQTTIVLFAIAFLVRCGRPVAAAQPAPQKTDVNAVTVEASMLPSLTIQQAALTKMPVSLPLTGKISFDDERYAHILSPVAGQITELRARVGEPVTRGEILALVHSRDAASAINDHAESEKDLELAEKTFTMTRDLYAHDAASKIALDQAEMDLAKAKAHVARTARSLSVLGLSGSASEPLVPLRSPIDGVVIARAVTNGQVVQGDATSLIDVASLDSLWVQADAFERDLPRIRVGQKADLVATAFPDRHFPAVVARISDTIDPATRTAKIRLVVPNHAHELKPEMFASIRVQTDDVETIVLLPATAQIVEDGKTFVFARTSPSTFQRREVVTEADGAGLMRVRTGVRPGDSIVVDGALLLRAEQQKD